MNQITDYLTITDIDEARTSSIEEDTVVTVCQESIADNVSDGCRYFHFNISDGEPDERYGGDDSYQCFADAVSTVREEVYDGNDVLVHCHMGQSRSAAVCIASLATIEDVSYSEAYRIVEDARPTVNPNPELVAKIVHYINEHELGSVIYQ